MFDVTRSSGTIDMSQIVRPAPSWLERLLRVVWKCSPQGPAFDALLTRRLPELKHLPECDPQDCIQGFDTVPVTIRQCPVGSWSTPLRDVVVLTKCAVGFGARRILEMGSYLGHTAMTLAENTDEQARVTALDNYPEHGAAYRNTPMARRIDRRTGRISPARFGPQDEYDLIFIDADHHFESVINDTQVALRVLGEKGIVIWHDYQQEEHFGGFNEVPQALKELSAYLPIVALRGTWLAMYSQYPGWETLKHLRNTASRLTADPWQDKTLRG